MKILNLLIILLLVSSCAHYNPRPWTKHEKTALIWSCAASAADMYTTTQFLKEEGTYEINPLLGEHPSDAEVIGVLVTAQVLAIWISHYFPDLRIPLLCGKGAVHTGFAVHNTTLY